MRELLVVAPLHIVLSAPVVPVMGRWSICFVFSEVDVLRLRLPLASRLTISVIKLEEAIVQVSESLLVQLRLVETSRHVALVIQVLGSDLSDVHVHEV